jgi:hypothetical protein
LISLIQANLYNFVHDSFLVRVNEKLILTFANIDEQRSVYQLSVQDGAFFINFCNCIITYPQNKLLLEPRLFVVNVSVALFHELVNQITQVINLLGELYRTDFLQFRSKISRA